MNNIEFTRFIDAASMDEARRVFADIDHIANPQWEILSFTEHTLPPATSTVQSATARATSPSAAPSPSWGSLSRSSTLVATVALGFAAICIGLYFTPMVMGIGKRIADHSDNKLLAIGGVAWAVGGPCLPYLMLGCVAALIARLSPDKARLILLTSFAMGAPIAFVHGWFKLELWGRMFSATGLVKWPIGFSLFYWLCGCIAIIVVAAKLGVDVDALTRAKSTPPNKAPEPTP